MHTIRVTSPLDVSPIRSRFHDQDARYLLYLSSCTLPFLGTAPLDAATLAPYTPTHTFTFRPQENACTHAYTRPRTTRTQVQRVHHAYIDDDVRGICTWRCAHVRFTDDRTLYSLPLRVEGASDSSPLESARIYGRDDMTATCEILRPMESPRRRTATSHSGRGEGE